MKTITFIFAFVLCAGFTQAQENSLNQRDSLNRKQGHWIYLGSDKPKAEVPANSKAEEGDYLDDKRVGVWTKYYENDSIKLIGDYVNDRPNGAYRKYYRNGKLKERGHFRENHYMDSIIRYYESGSIQSYSIYNESGIQQGWHREFKLDGTVAFEAYYINDLPQKSETDATPLWISCGGPPQPRTDHPMEPIHPSDTVPRLPNTGSLSWNPNGYNKVYNMDNEIWQDGVFKDGRLVDGKIYTYDRDGVLLRVKLYKDGLYYSDGQL